MHPDIEHAMLTGYPSNEYLEYEREQEEEVYCGPFDDMNDFFLNVFPENK